MALRNPLQRLQKLPKDITFFTATYCPENVYQSIAFRYLSTPYHPLQPKIRHAYKTRERGILWWSVLQGQLTSENRRTRSVYLRKSRRAVVDALEERGFDADGRKKIVDQEKTEGKEVDDTIEKTANITPPTSNLVGTFELALQRPILKASQEEIKSQAGSILDVIISSKTKRPQDPLNKPKPKIKTKKASNKSSCSETKGTGNSPPKMPKGQSQRKDTKTTASHAK